VIESGFVWKALSTNFMIKKERESKVYFIYFQVIFDFVKLISFDMDRD